MISADTNVFVYLYQQGFPDKTEAARRITEGLIKTQAIVGLQVVGELQNVMARKLRRSPVEAAEAGRRLLMTFSTFAPTRSAASQSLSQMASGRMSYWDALLVFSASDAGVKTVLSEDMQNGAVISGVRVINPFGRNGGVSEDAALVLGL